MISINEVLLNGISKYLIKYDCSQEEIGYFLNFGGTFLERQRCAIHILEGIMTAHGKKELLRQVSELARVEYNIRELEPKSRDHVVHALLSSILGIYINENYLGKIHDITVDDFQWKLAGLFHDIGYPIEISVRVMQSFADKINEIRRNFSDTRSDIYFQTVPVGLDNLENGVSSLDLIQKCLDGWGLKIDARKTYYEVNNHGKIDHGTISALSVLYLVDIMYQNYNPRREYGDICKPETKINFNQKYFEEDVVSSCAAIFIHNLPKQYFSAAKIDLKKSPIAYLLKLSDCLQQWERPSREEPKGFTANQFNIEIIDKQLVFLANVSPDRRKNIEIEISSTLMTPDTIVLK
jgi:hypothetical protein